MSLHRHSTKLEWKYTTYTQEDRRIDPSSTVCKDGRREREEWENKGGVNLFKACCTHVWNYHNEILHIHNVC
jgi:hypothetical protein